MDPKKTKRLEKTGYRITDARELAGLSEAEDRMIRTRLALVRHIRARREKLGWTQAELAKAMGSTQAWVAKMESASPQVSVDLLLRGAFALGSTPEDLSRALKVA